MEGGDTFGQIVTFWDLSCLGDRSKDICVPHPEVLPELRLEAADVSNNDIVHVALGHRIKGKNLFLDWNRVVLRLFENFDDTTTTLELGKRRGIEFGPELGERCELAELGQVQPQWTSDLLHGAYLSSATNTRYRLAGIQRRTNALKEQIGLEETLSIGDGDHVRRDIRRDVVGLGLDDGKTCQAAATELI